MNKKKLYQKAIDAWGMTAQINMAIEECAELIVALQHQKRHGKHIIIDDILDEMVDVEIMLEQLRIIFDYYFDGKSTVFDVLKRGKLKRLEKLLNEL